MNRFLLVESCRPMMRPHGSRGQEYSNDNGECESHPMIVQLRPLAFELRTPIVGRRFRSAAASVHAAPAPPFVFGCVIEKENAVRILTASQKGSIAVFQQPCGRFRYRNKKVA